MGYSKIFTLHVFRHFVETVPEVYLEPCQTFIMELFVKMVKVSITFSKLTIATLDQGVKYV